MIWRRPWGKCAREGLLVTVALYIEKKRIGWSNPDGIRVTWSQMDGAVDTQIWVGYPVRICCVCLYARLMTGIHAVKKSTTLLTTNGREDNNGATVASTTIEAPESTAKVQGGEGGGTAALIPSAKKVKGDTVMPASAGRQKVVEKHKRSLKRLWDWVISIGASSQVLTAASEECGEVEAEQMVVN